MAFSVSVSKLNMQRALRKIMPVAMKQRDKSPGKIHFSVDGSNNLRIAAHDSGINPQMSVVCELGIPCEIFDPFCIVAYQFNACINAMSDSNDIVLSRRGKSLVIANGSNVSRLVTSDGDRYPAILSPKDQDYLITIDHSKIKNLFGAADLLDEDADGQTLVNSVCMLFDGKFIRVFATNRYRCAYVWEEHVHERVLEVLIRANVLQEVKKHFWDGDVSLYFDGARMFFILDGFYIYGTKSVMDRGGVYPRKELMETLSDELAEGAVISSDSIKAPLIACATMTGVDHRFVSVSVDIIDRELIISSKENQSGTQSFSVPVKKQFGNNTRFCVNSAHISHAVGLIDQLDGEDGLSDIQIRVGKSSNFIFIVRHGVNARYAFTRMVDN